MRTFVTIAFFAIALLMAWTLYANVFASDTALRVEAEKLARETSGCRSCARLRFAGSSSILGKTYSFTFDKTGTTVIGCRRPYIAFGTFHCALK